MINRPDKPQVGEELWKATMEPFGASAACLSYCSQDLSWQTVMIPFGRDNASCSVWQDSRQGSCSLGEQQGGRERMRSQEELSNCSMSSGSIENGVQFSNKPSATLITKVLDSQHKDPTFRTSASSCTPQYELPAEMLIISMDRMCAEPKGQGTGPPCMPLDPLPASVGSWNVMECGHIGKLRYPGCNPHLGLGWHR